MIIDTVGILNAYEYYKSYQKLGTDARVYGLGYLNVGYYWWLITPCYDTTSVQFIDNSGYLDNISMSSPINRNSLRPSVNLKSTIVIKSGSGTKQDPFVVGLPS